jgi:hypothetical protein
MKKLFVLLTTILLPLMANAHDIEVKNADGVTIYYDYINEGKDLAVSFRGSYYADYSDEYQGNVVIPEEVTYMNRILKVTSIKRGILLLQKPHFCHYLQQRDEHRRQCISRLLRPYLRNHLQQRDKHWRRNFL